MYFWEACLSRTTLICVKKIIDWTFCMFCIYIYIAHVWSSFKVFKLNRNRIFHLHRNHLPPQKQSTVNRDVVRYPGPALNQAQRGGRSVRQATDPDALKKITLLENELLKLRAQIAMIVTAAPAPG